MHVLGNLMDHVMIVSRMAKATRTDLVGARDTGDLTQAGWARMVQTCRGCACAGTCPEWLDTHVAVSAPPQRCPNRAVFKALRSRARHRAMEEV